MKLTLVIAGILVLLLLNEAWWHKRRGQTEYGRKFIHITVGCVVALLPFVVSWGQIELLGAAFLVSVSLSKYFHIFKAIHSVQRPTWGEVYFALAVGLLAVLTHDKWIYLTALLQMSLADGLAAVVGRTFGGSTRYQVLGHTKSLAGTLTFFVVSALLLVLYAGHTGQALPPGFIVGLALLASAAENIGIHGLDNLLVPLLVAVVLINH